MRLLHCAAGERSGSFGGMKWITPLFLAYALSLPLSAAESKDGWISLFDGKSLEGWTANEHPETFSVKDGEIVVRGVRAHLFYDGAGNNHAFKNFEFKAEVMAKAGSNSGVYFHTQLQGEGWPSK